MATWLLLIIPGPILRKIGLQLHGKLEPRIGFLGAHYLAKIRDRSVFEIRKVAEGYVLVPLVPDLTIEIQSTPVDLVAAGFASRSQGDLPDRDSVGLDELDFSSLRTFAIPSLTTRQKDAEWGIFRRSLGAAAVILGVLMVATLLLPKVQIGRNHPSQFQDRS